MPSELAGTVAIWILLGVAILIAARSRPGPSRLAACVPAALAATALQTLHFAEEFVTGFYSLFPARLGLTPWSAEFFVAFNAIWLACWLAAAAAAVARRATMVAAALLWFLALAAIGNGIAHPLLAWSAGGYFPGLLTAPFLGLMGVPLLRRLTRQAEPSITPVAPP